MAGPRIERKRAFARYLFEGASQVDAYTKAGYAPSLSSPCKMARDPFVVSEIARLRQDAEDNTIMEIIERKQLLSVIGRSQLTDFLNPDGTLKPIDRNSPSTAALSELIIEGGKRGTTTRIKLHDPIRAIEVLNKMDGVYSDASPQGPVTNNILVVAPDTLRELEFMLRAIHASDGPLDLLGEVR